MPVNTNIRKIIDSPDFISRLEAIYGLDQIDYQKKRYIFALEKFVSLYGDAPITVFSAPGRTEICGNHTDHQHGVVLAASVDLDTIAVVSPMGNNKINIHSEGYSSLELDISDLNIHHEEMNTSSALVRGVCKGTLNRGYKIGGFNAYITSNVISGAGLSSSASYEALIGTILSHIYNEGRINMVQIAQIGQYAENVYFGKPCGLMDQIACSVGGLVHIDFQNSENPQIEKIDFDFAKTGYTVCITDTKASHADLTPDYAAIPAEMKTVANYFGKNYLREVEEDDFVAALPELYKSVNHRAILRAIHYYRDSEFVENEVTSLKENHFQSFLDDVNLSGNSSFKYLQNIYSIKNYEHQSVSIALAVSQMILGTRGAVRIHGGGFAGTILAFVPDDMIKEYRQSLDRIFGDGCSHIIKIRKYGGIKVI